MTDIEIHKIVLNAIKGSDWAHSIALAAPDPDTLEKFFKKAKPLLLISNPELDNINIQEIDFRLLRDQLQGTDKLYTVREVAEMLGRVRQSIYMYIKDGELPAVQLGKGWRIKRSDLIRFLEGREFKTKEKAKHE